MYILFCSETAVIVDEGSLARKKNKKKRNITWAPDDQIVKIRYFELLEGERKGIIMFMILRIL